MYRIAYLLIVCSVAACKVESTASTREQEICAASPNICVDGKIVAKRFGNPLSFKVPDLIVRSVSCDARAGSVYMSGHVANVGPVATPGGVGTVDQVYISATVYPNTSQAQTFLTNGSGLDAAGTRGDNYNGVVHEIPGADPTNLPLTLFQVTVNSPQPPDFPSGKIWESNSQNNSNCGVCSCDATHGCTTIPTPSCTAGP